MQNTPWVRAGYILDESDPDILVLRRSDGTFVAAFNADAATKESILGMLKSDHGANVYDTAGKPKVLRHTRLSEKA